MLRKQSIIVNRRGDVYDIQAGLQMTIDGGADQIYIIRIQYAGAPPRIRRGPLDHEGFEKWIELLKARGFLITKEEITSLIKSEES